MTQGKGKRDEKLIEELYEKLYWYTYEASEEEFDCNEVDAIVRLLDVLDPKEDDPKFPSDPVMAFERFKSRFGLEEEFAEADGEAGDGTPDNEDSGYTAGLEAGMLTGKSDIGESAEDRKRKRRGHRTKWKKWLGRTAIGAAVCLVLMLSVNFGSYALKKKSFFEVVREEVGRTKVTVTGNVEGIDDGESGKVTCDSWAEVEYIVGEDLLQPKIIPNGYLLKKITIKDLEYKVMIIALYEHNTHILRVEADIFPEEFSDNVILYDKEWELLEEEKDGRKAKYYGKDDQIEAFFTHNKTVYYIFSNDTLEVVQEIIDNMA